MPEFWSPILIDQLNARTRQTVSPKRRTAARTGQATVLE